MQNAKTAAVGLRVAIRKAQHGDFSWIGPALDAMDTPEKEDAILAEISDDDLEWLLDYLNEVI